MKDINNYRKFYKLTQLIKKNFFKTNSSFNQDLGQMLKFFLSIEDIIVFIKYKGSYIVRPKDLDDFKSIKILERFEDFSEWNSMILNKYYNFLQNYYNISDHHEGYYKSPLYETFMEDSFISIKEKQYFNKLKLKQIQYLKTKNN